MESHGEQEMPRLLAPPDHTPRIPRKVGKDGKFCVDHVTQATAGASYTVSVSICSSATRRECPIIGCASDNVPDNVAMCWTPPACQMYLHALQLLSNVLDGMLA